MCHRKFTLCHILQPSAISVSPVSFTADIYAFLVVFVLPLNSAVNPILYTFTTPKYRNQVLLRGWNKLTSRKLTRNDGSGHTGSGSNHGMNFYQYYYSKSLRCLSTYLSFVFVPQLPLGHKIRICREAVERTPTKITVHNFDCLQIDRGIFF